MKGLFFSILFSVFFVAVVGPVIGVRPTFGETLWISLVTFGVVLIQEEVK